MCFVCLFHKHHTYPLYSNSIALAGCFIFWVEKRKLPGFSLWQPFDWRQNKKKNCIKQWAAQMNVFFFIHFSVLSERTCKIKIWVHKFSCFLLFRFKMNWTLRTNINFRHQPIHVSTLSRQFFKRLKCVNIVQFFVFSQFKCNWRSVCVSVQMNKIMHRSNVK